MEVFLRIGETAVRREGDVIRTVLGSCIGLCLWDDDLKIGGMAHIMLPDGPEEEKKSQPGKYAVTAADALMKDLIRQAEGKPVKLIAKIAGGASMFYKPDCNNSVFGVGRRNSAVVREALARLDIEVAFEHVDGRKGRNISLDCSTGVLTVRVQEGRSITG
jgi:chemotaxis protein CheD